MSFLMYNVLVLKDIKDFLKMKEESLFGSFFLIIFLAFIGLFFAVGDLSAQTTPDRDAIKTQPSIIEEVVDAGDVKSFTITVTNKSERTETFYPAVENMRGISDQGEPLFTTEDETGFGLSEWASIDQSSVTLDPEESGKFSFTISVPEEAGPQGYYGAFFVSRLAPEQRQTGASVDIKVGTLLSFRIQGDAHEEAVIREFVIGKNIYQNNEKVEFTIVVENLGNVLARPRGVINLVNMFGDQVAQVVVNHPRPGGVFLGASRTFNVEWEPEGFNFGRIHAELDLTYGETGERTISDKASFWVLPVRAMMFGAIGIIVFVATFFVLVRIYIKHQIKRVTGGRKVPAYATIQAYSKPISKLTLITIATILFTVIFAGFVLFLFS